MLAVALGGTEAMVPFMILDPAEPGVYLTNVRPPDDPFVLRLPSTSAFGTEPEGLVQPFYLPAGSAAFICERP
jgi:hypothetical protein